ncbi:hypothetical protein IOD16_33955 [Saccharothrix sp. 6-C]|uniref:Uncharacterized protein n=1 Tax=Saccharothrix texasensis TaxID=103734 RepID=A0A3N1HC09_9PSEU|nr:hypothetical protein [Saccharothrix sp. 6-C]QQQ76005.1 hypothetical protein IOD16_33955 [Saccharothrix sp. 6-C]ROP39822.1 hypothetical protein EDD40_5221 [Saccharothrix texasensis]
MSEILVALAALTTGVALGLVVRSAGRRRAPLVADARELLHAADDLEYGLNTVLEFGPLSLSELASVDLPAKLDRVASTGEVPRAALATLKAHTDKIALHPYPEQRDLLTAVREDEAAVWLALRDAIGSGAAQHVAATQARLVLDEIRGGLRSERREQVLV